MAIRSVAIALFFVSASASAFTFEDFVEVLRTQKITTLPAAIAALPKDIRSSYELMSLSKSAQPSSPENPRAILFGDTGRFIVTFNGDPKHANYDRLEFLQYRDSKQFELRFIQFGTDGVRISEKNPRSCTVCHGENPQPIFGSYGDWPGTYGTDDRVRSGSPDANNLQDFLAKQGQHERYRHLIRNPLHPLYPFANSDGDDFLSHSARPGNRLGNLLGRLVAESAAEFVKTKSLYYRDHRFTALLGLVDLAPMGSNYYNFPCLPRAEDREAYDAKLARDLRRAYPQADYPLLYEELALLENAEDIRDFTLQKLLLGPEGRWDINHFAKRGKIGEGRRYFLGAAALTGFVAARLLEEETLTRPELMPFYKPVGTVALFNESYVQRYIAPHDFWYNQAGLFFDVNEFKGACGLLMNSAAQEWK